MILVKNFLQLCSSTLSQTVVKHGLQSGFAQFSVNKLDNYAS